MKFLVFLFLAATPSLIHGFENGLGDLPMKENKLIEPNSILYSRTRYTDCGGVIPLSPVYDSYISYKDGQFNDPWEFCVWTLLPGDQVTNVRVLVYQNFANSNNGITVYFLNSTGITSKKLAGTDTEFNFNTRLAFLVFVSDSGTQSNGFYISMYSTGDSATTSTAAYHVRKDGGEFSYPIKDPMRNRDKAVALILQRKTPGLVETHLEVNLENVLIDEMDAIQVYSFNHRWMAQPLALIGRFTTDATFQVPSFNPVLILLESGMKNLKGKGFQVEWKPYTHSIQ